MELKNITTAKILKRYKRFLADVELADGSIKTVHCANSGSMKSCWEEGWKVAISDSKNPKRKLQYTLEMTNNGNSWIGVNTQVPNKIAFEAISVNIIPELTDFDELKREVKYGENSRIDILGKKGDQLTYIEVKNVTLLEDGFYQFPDAVSSRGQKHLKELMNCVKEGHRAVMLFTVQRNDASAFKPASDIDPEYAKLLKQAFDNGVEILVYQAELSLEEITLTNKKIDLIL